VELNRTLKKRIIRLGGKEVNQVPVKVLPLLARAAGNVLRGDRLEWLLRRISERVQSALPLLSPLNLANLIWTLSAAQAIDEQLQQRFTDWLARKVPDWNKRSLDELWRIVCAYAKSGIHDIKLMKLAARRAIQEDLTTLSNWGLASLTWSFDELAEPSDGLAAFRRLLKIEVQRRTFSQKVIAGSRFGRGGGGDPELKLLFDERGKKPRKKPILPASRPWLSLSSASVRKKIDAGSEEAEGLSG